MNPADLALLLDVARTGSFAGAARVLGVDPSSVGRTVAGIETDLGIRLFERTTRRMEMTEVGARYLARIAPLLEEIAQAGDEARDARAEPSGTLRLSASVTFGQRVIVPRLAAFRAAYPAIRVECVFTDANVDLVADRIDLAIRLGPVVEGDLIVSKLMDTRYRVVAASDYLARSAPLERPEDMAQHRAILFPFRGFRSRWLFRDGRGKIIEQPIDGDLVLTPALALREACLAGLGPTLLPDWLIGEDIASGRLVWCLPDWDVTATTFDTAAWLVYPSRSYLPAKVRAMIDFLRDTTG